VKIVRWARCWSKADIDKIRSRLLIGPMSDLNIPIERHEELHGNLRETGQPDLIAHRPEPWRFTRLVRVLGATKALATQQIGPDAAQAITEAMLSIADYKGDFHIIWRQSKHK
jgi:hypothetical protein